MDLTELYREVILDHNRHPRNQGLLEPCDSRSEGHNPLCGDRLTLTLRLNGEQLSEVTFQAQGCAISTASASLMTEAVKGLPRPQVQQLFERMHALLTDRSASSEGLGKLAALAGVREFPMRVKCASLCWHTLQAALANADATASLNAAAPSHSTPTVSTE